MHWKIFVVTPGRTCKVHFCFPSPPPLLLMICSSVKVYGEWRCVTKHLKFGLRLWSEVIIKSPSFYVQGEKSRYLVYRKVPGAHLYLTGILMFTLYQNLLLFLLRLQWCKSLFPIASNFPDLRAIFTDMWYDSLKGVSARWKTRTYTRQ